MIDCLVGQRRTCTVAPGSLAHDDVACTVVDDDANADLGTLRF